MRHARSDYDPIQDPRPGGIDADEPVFILRAQDITAPMVVEYWGKVAAASGSALILRDYARRWAAEMRAWQADHHERVKAPDVPRDALRPDLIEMHGRE